MPLAHILGFPRIGSRRELKVALEAYWEGALNETALRDTGRELRQRHWALQKAAGLDFVTVGDFAFYDHLHNVTALISAAPERFALHAPIDLRDYFAMARGTLEQPALALKKRFDTNYHYLVPESDRQTDEGHADGTHYDAVLEFRAR
jgi:5-methyltetrahydropteroyltriglutamate--homocysteine methyltransferase